MLKWLRNRDETTCEVSYILYDLAREERVAVIRNIGRGQRRFRVQIEQRVPWHRHTLESAKRDCEHVYINTRG